MRFCRSSIILLSFTIFGFACAKEEETRSPSENVQQAASAYSIVGQKKLFTCQPTAFDRQSEYIWLFIESESGEVTVAISEITPLGEHGIYHNGLVRLRHVAMASSGSTLTFTTSGQSFGSYGDEYSGEGAELIKIDSDSLSGKVVDIKGYASYLDITCSKNLP
jgi:hypothetical protein